MYYKLQSQIIITNNLESFAQHLTYDGGIWTSSQ